MHAHSPLSRRRHTAEPQPVVTHFDPGWRWNRRATATLHSLRSEPHVRPTTVFESYVAPPEESAAATTAESTSSRFRSTAAAYGAPGSYVHAQKLLSPPPLLSGQSRSNGHAGVEGRDVFSNVAGNRYANVDGRRSSLGYSSPLSAPPPSMETGVGGGRGGSSIAAAGAEATATHYRTSSRFAESSGTARTTSLLPARVGGAAVAGSPLRTKPPASASTPPPSSYLIPPPQPQDVGKLVVVLDLDETLVYSRGITLYERPGVTQLLKTLKGKCELIVWTAGTREYALDVIRIIDTVCAVQHCIYRHPMWWSGDAGCAKDLRMLGRPMDRVILVDNTPSVFSANPRNSLLVSDFIVPFPHSYDAQEKVLATLTDIFDHVFRRFAQPCLADVLASKRIVRQVVFLEKSGGIELNVLTVRRAVEATWATSTRASRARNSK
jgi:carboxy-terminal domain RNA polymerase II polypeptide A small phosphatase